MGTKVIKLAIGYQYYKHYITLINI